jgi:Short C-terminal domain
MSLSDELQKLQDLRRSGALTDEEFSAAKAAVLARHAAGGDPAPEPGVNAQLEEIRLQNDVARLDREWELERGRYMVAGKYGRRHLPTRASSVFGGVIIVAFGLFWTVTAGSIAGGGLFPLFGVVFIIAGIGMSVFSFKKAEEYEQGHDAYRRRRSRLLEDRDDPLS